MPEMRAARNRDRRAPWDRGRPARKERARRARSQGARRFRVQTTCKNVVVYDNVRSMILIRQVSWLKAAARDFGAFPIEVQTDAAQALSIAARGGKADTAKPFKGLEGGVFEIALRHRGDAFRVIYAVQIGASVWVVHAFKKKSKSGIKTPRMQVDLIRERLKRLKEALK